MGRIRRCRLSWKPSESEQVVAYKLYWSHGGEVDYDSNFLQLGNVCELFLPEGLGDIPLNGKVLWLALTAVDKHGNESELVHLEEPYRFSVPPAPTGFSLSILEDVVEAPASPPSGDATHGDRRQAVSPGGRGQPPSRPSPPLNFNPPENRIKYYDDVGYRKLEID